MNGPLPADTPVVLIVDDQPDNLSLLGALLAPIYRVRVASSGERALTLVRVAPLPALILLDVMMPGLDGYAVLAQLQSDTRLASIPVIFLTAMGASEDEARGLACGAVDYISKPIRAETLLARIKTQLELKRLRDDLQHRNVWLEKEIERRLQENQLIQDVSILALAHLAETRDGDTGNHLRRTQGYVSILARHLLAQGYPDPVLSEHYITLLVKSAVLHDIGKVGIPDHVLLKPGKLTADEWQVMQRHAELGAQAIEMAERDARHPVAFLSLAKQIAHFHHEKWDGSGYPQRLKGRDIPLCARLMAVADVFDALISPRCYKPPLPAEVARDMIVAERGRHFDPDIVDAFLAHFPRFVEVAQRYREPEAPTAPPSGPI